MMEGCRTPEMEDELAQSTYQEPPSYLIFTSPASTTFQFQASLLAPIKGGGVQWSTAQFSTSDLSAFLNASPHGRYTTTKPVTRTF